MKVLGMSSDLGGRVGWLPKAERVKTLFLSPLQPQNAGGGGGGRRGGVAGVSRLRFPPGPHLRSSRFSRHPRLQALACYHNPQCAELGGVGWFAKTLGACWMIAEGGEGENPPKCGGGGGG